MKNLIYKELKLVILPATYLFFLLAALLIIPNYPYIVGLSYCLVIIFITFSNAQTNKDHEFTSMLPIPRNEIVKSKFFTVIFIELLQMLAAVPFALISSFVVNKSGNLVGLDANITLFGIFLLCFGTFNIIFMPWYFKTGYRAGLPMLFGMIAYVLVYVVFEIIIQLVPVLKANLDGLALSSLPYQLIVLAAGAVFYAATIIVSYKISVKNFERVSL